MFALVGHRSIVECNGLPYKQVEADQGLTVDVSFEMEAVCGKHPNFLDDGKHIDVLQMQ